MRVKLLLFLALALVLSSCSFTEQDIRGKPVVYVIEEPKALTFVVVEDNPLGWVDETIENRLQQNVRRFMDEDMEELEEFEIKGRLRNTRRIIDGKLIVGFDEDLDNPEFKDPYQGYDGTKHSRSFKIER
jgi:hypothetical protein